MNTTAIANALIEAWESHDLAKTAELLADDFVLTGPAPVPLGKQEFLMFQAVHNEAFGDWRFNPEAAQPMGEQVKFAIQITSTHTGLYAVDKLGLPIPPVAATGKRRQWPREALTFTVHNGQIVALHADTTSEGGVVGALAWLGVELPAPPTPKQLAERWSNLWNADSDLAVIDEIIAPDFVSHSAPPGIPTGRAGVKPWLLIFRNAFSDLYARTQDLIVGKDLGGDDQVVIRFIGGGTHDGDFFGIPATGRKAEMTGINILRIANGQIVEHWGNSDDLGFMRQLGVIG